MTENAMNAVEYLTQLAQTAGLTDDVKAGLLKAAENQQFAKGLEEGTMLRSDYSRQSDALTVEKKKSTDYYGQLLNWKAEQDAIYADLAKNNGGNPNPQPVVSDFLTKKDFEAAQKSFNDELARRESIQISLLKDVGRLASQHVYEFKEPLDTDALEKVAIERKLSLRQAYDEMVAPRRKETADAQRKTDLDNARAEGAREFASKHKIPVDTAPREYHTIFDQDRKKQVGVDDYVPNSGQLSATAERNLREGFAEEWYKSERAASGTSGG